MYSIYSLTDGELGTDTTAETYVEACELYEQAIAHEYALRESMGADYAETTVHLYFPEWGVMEAEAVIERVGIDGMTRTQRRAALAATYGTTPEQFAANDSDDWRNKPDMEAQYGN